MTDVPDKTTLNNNLGAACYRCRGFRHACDRTKPGCTRCKRRGITCTYPEAAPTLKKLQKATETLGDRIKKFGELLKTDIPNTTTKPKCISLQRLAQPRSSVAPEIFNEEEQQQLEQHDDDDNDSISTISTISNNQQVVSTSSFSVYPCSKCYKDLQQCDLSLPSCSRCSGSDFQCVYLKTEPKANHVSQVLNTMNKVMDQWQESIDKMAKDFAQKTRDFGQRVDQSFKKKPSLQPFAWKITTTHKGLSVESNVNSYNDLSKLVDQFKRTMHITPPNDTEHIDSLDDTSSIHTSSGFSFGVWNSLSHATSALPDNYPVDISPELTDSLIELYCRTPCCSSIRLPIIDTVEFLNRYHDPNPENRPSIVLIYAVCAMAARNAFQVHVWSKRPAHDTPHYNMGKALSMAYCLKSREQLADCFDIPSIDNCQAAFLLSYCNQQNGYNSVIHIYEWISFTMAQELGLYDEGRELSSKESMLVWCLYYFNTWYRVLQGNSNNDSSAQLHPCCQLPPPPEKPQILDFMEIDATGPPQDMIEYYIYTEWYCMIQLQVLRHDCMSRLLESQAAGKQDTTLSKDLLVLQDRLQRFYDQLPFEWKNPDLESIALDQMASFAPEAFCINFGLEETNSEYHVDIHEFARFCVLNVHVFYNINKILLYQAFFPSENVPTSPFSLQCLYTCIDAAYAITQTLDIMVKHHDECNIPLLGFLFANMIYIKLLSYNVNQYQEFASRCLVQSLNISKMSKAYLYDFEQTKNLVAAMEQDVLNACGPIVKSEDMYPFPPTLPQFIQF